MTKRVISVAAIATVMTVLSASLLSDVYAQPGAAGSFTDSRDGKKYRTVKIGNLTWMAENLNFATDKSVCYDNKESNCQKYGRLYDWATVMNINTSYNSSEWDGSDINHKGVCPVGWHVASDAEWTALTDFVGSDAWTKLRFAAGWKRGQGYIRGTDDYVFSALPGGLSFSGFFIGVGIDGHWWTASGADDGVAWLRNMRCCRNEVNRNIAHKRYKLSVRCVEDFADLR